MTAGDAAIAWTARLAVMGYLGRVAIDIAGRTDDRSQQFARWLWTLGLAIFLLHVAAAFHFRHHWSHAAAWAHVRQQTQSLTGWDSGVGLFINDGFALLWMVDCGLWWRSLHWPRNRPAYWTVQAISAFLVFNATVVFGPPGWKMVAVIVGVGLMLLRMFRPTP